MTKYPALFPYSIPYALRPTLTMFAPLSMLKHNAPTRLVITQCLYFLMLLMVLAFPCQQLHAADTSGQTTQAPSVSTDPNAQPSILETIGIPNSQAPNPTGTAACTGNTGSPSCGEHNVASQSNQSQTNLGAGNPINVITGNKYQREEDLPALPGLMGIEVVRHYNSLHMGLGQIGYGWRLSYETDLQVVNNTLRITQADGSRIIFNRSSINPSDCACQNPAQGHVMIYHTAKGDEYTWFWLNGKQLHFNHQGKLTRITAPSGESVHLTRGLKGELLKVTDPQGRSLIMHYADKRQAGFKGIVAIDTPVGRYHYSHENAPKSKGISNLTQVKYPATDVQKIIGQTPLQHALVKYYHYGETVYIAPKMANATRSPAIPQAAHLLTGISLAWQEGNAAKTQRIRTWGYDALGRGILSVHGLPKQLDANGNAIANTGVQQVNLRYQVGPAKAIRVWTPPEKNTHHHPRISHNGQIGQTILTNSLGQTTIYNYTLIAGEHRLLQVVGAGCTECGETNVVYGYDKLARLSHVTQVKALQQSHVSQATKPNNTNTSGKAIAKDKTVLQGLHTTQTEYDSIGRIIRISSIEYDQGKALPPQLKIRYAYPSTPSFPQLNTAKRAVQEPVQVFSEPSLIAKPSVVAGREHQWHITYNQLGQPLQKKETGYRPALPSDVKSNGQIQGIAISRNIDYRYRMINNRSLLSSVDGPLPNGETNTPKDSDVTQYQYDKLGQYLTKIIAPNNIITQLTYDKQGEAHASAMTGGTGRVVNKIDNNSITYSYDYNHSGKVISTQRYPASLNLGTAKASGLLQSTAMAYDVFGNNTMIKRADGQAIHLQYGVDGKLIAMRDALGNRVEWKDWAKGSLKQGETVTTQQWFTADAPDTVARAWYFWRDNQNRLSQRLSPDGGVDTWRYADRKASDTEQTLQAEAANDANWVQHIDPLNRMTLNAVSSQGSVQIRATPAGYLDASFILNANTVNTSATSSHSNQQPINQPVQVLDDFGRAILFSSPQHGTHIAQYNDANRITNIQQADGTRIQYTYDIAGRLLTKTAQAPKSKASDSVTYSYNAFGLRQLKDSTQTLTFIQDLLGREIGKATTLILKNRNAKTYHIRTRYTLDGQVKAKQLINGDWLVFSLEEQTGLTKAMTIHRTIWPSLTNKIAIWFNLPDLPLQIATKQPVVTDIKVHPFNGITQLTHGNGFSDHYDFDLAGRLTTVSHSKQPQNSNTNSQFIKASYTYDAGRRLISEQISTADIQGKFKAYAYTGWNNFSTPPKSGFIKAVVSTTPNNNMDAGIPKARFSYADTAETTLDQAGRTTADQHYRYQYNVWGKLASVQNKANQQTIASYQSNALGERVMVSYPTSTSQGNASQTRYYVYDKQKRIAELDEAGNVIQQYLYVNQTPVALINTPIASSDTNQEGVIAIHTDRRHAPMMATDEQGKVIWQAEYDAWGILIQINHQEQSSQFNMNLRLPGQWQDQATGLYYNYQRDYNPDTGRYLTPDPLGFPDGADPYAYVNNDPLNKLDPLGLYQSDIHYYMTFFLAVAAGVPADDARTIALATQYIDDNPDTEPLNISSGITDEHRARLLTYHFTAIEDIKIDPDTGKVSGRVGEYGNPSVDTNTGVRPTNDQLTRLLKASETAEKCVSKNAGLQLFGEYMHAFQDTFAHRDQNNNPFALNVGFGHGGYDSHPDYTYNHWSLLPIANWDNNESRTYSMELLVFLEMKKYATGDDVITQGKISEQAFYQLLKEFNAIEEHEDSGYEKSPPLGKKIEKLQEELNKLFGEGIINIKDLNSAAYNETQAASNRASYLCYSGKPLDQKVYEGTILPTTCK
ncbi:MAG: RHS repeat-associated core domain-containing protein [Methylophilus sp.]|nr:RHS repeat-associated core domain-containing protein [Methylophilus sp.]